MGKTTTIEDTDVIPATTETSSDDNIINCNTSTCIKDKILSAIDHIKNVRHKRADTDSIFEFISKNSPDVDKCIVISTLKMFERVLRASLMCICIFFNCDCS